MINQNEHENKNEKWITWIRHINRTWVDLVTNMLIIKSVTVCNDDMY